MTFSLRQLSARSLRFLCLGLLTAAVALCCTSAGASATARVRTVVCNQQHWCTVTAAGDASPTHSQLAIGNVRDGTVMAVSQSDWQQYGGEVLTGTLRGLCAWSQYDRDWTGAGSGVIAGCANPVFATAQYVAAGGRDIWSGCYPRCFGGVPLHLDPRCGRRGHDWCYRYNCEEYANFSPWSRSAQPTDPLRRSHGQWLNLRYLARYQNVRNGHYFYLVDDTAAAHGAGNWVFVDGGACDINAGAPGYYHKIL